MSEKETTEPLALPDYDSTIDVSTYGERIILEFTDKSGKVTATYAISKYHLRWLITQLRAAKREIRKLEKEEAK